MLLNAGKFLLLKYYSSRFVHGPSHHSGFDHLQYAKMEGESLVHFITWYDVSVYLGRQRGWGVPGQKNAFRTRILRFETGVVCFSLSKRSKLQHWGQKSQGKGLKLILSSEDHFPPPSGSEVTIPAHTAAPECAMKPSLYKCVNCIQNTFNDSSLVLVMAYDSPSRFNGGGGSRHKKKLQWNPA